VAVGFDAGAAVTEARANTLIGYQAGTSLTSGNSNSVLGYTALGSDTLGDRAVAIGVGALGTQNFTTATDNYNVAVGFNAGTAVTTGENNVFIGGLCGDSLTTADNCNFIGKSAGGDGVVTGNSNNALGVNALFVLTSGANNTAVGDSAGVSVSSGSNNLLLGHDAGRTGSPGGIVSTNSNVLVLGDENIAQAFTQVSISATSDERDKTEFVGLDLGLDFVKALEPVTYYWDKRSKYGDKTADDYDLNAQTPDGTHKEDWMDIGFKAQSVQALEEAAGYKVADKKNLTVTLSEDGKQYGLKYERFIPILVKAIKDQDAIITSLTARVAALES